MQNPKKLNPKKLKSEKFVLNENDLKNSWDLIQKSEKIALLTHRNPDGDAIGSCFALDKFLKKFDKKTEIIYPTEPEFEYKRYAKQFLVDKHSQTPDLIICCDTATFDRLYWPKEFSEIPLINIDHHISSTINGKFNFIEGDVSSASELLFFVLSEWDFESIDINIAEDLLFGIMSDSQAFHTKATTAQTFRVVANLVDLGANMFQIKNEIFSNKSSDVIKLWEFLFKRIEIDKNKKAVWSYLTQEDLKSLNLQLNATVGFINFLSEVSDIDVSMFFYETDEGESKVSLRSKEYDVNKLASKFGGGGHINAAGILSDKSLQKLIEEVVEVI